MTDAPKLPERKFRIPADAAWTPNGEFTYTKTTEVGFDYILEAARLLVGVSRLNGISVQGLIHQAMVHVEPVRVAGEALPVDPLS